MYKIEEPIYYDNKDLNDVAGLLITGYSTYTPPINNLNSFDVALDSKSVSVTRNEQSRKITIEGIIRTSDRIDLENSLDTLNRYIKKLNKILNVPLRGSRYEFRNTTYQNMVIRDVAGGMAKISVEFLAADPFSYATELSTALSTTNITSVPQSLVVNFEGNTEQLPIITINSFTLEPETSSKQITITNPVTTESITVNRVFTDAEVVIFNFDTREVTVDDVVVDYSGIFFGVDPDVTALTITDNFTSRDFDIKIEYYKRYI